MNVHTFKDVGKRDSLANDVDDEGDDDVPVVRMRGTVDGEEEQGKEKFNDIGEVMEPFNLKEERETGFYDEGGNYVFKKERQEMDAWVADLDEAAMEKAIGETARAQERKRRRQEEEELIESKRPNRSLESLKSEIAGMMETGETVTLTMKRLAALKSKGGVKKPVNNWKKKSQAVISGLGEGKKVEGKGVSPSKAPVDTFIELVDMCISQHGVFHMYSLTVEAIQASLVRWEYRTSDPTTGSTDPIFGPFTADQIAQWKTQGYLTGSTAVYMRRHVKKQEVKPLDMFDDIDNSDDNDDENTTLSSESNPWVHSDSIDFGEYIPPEKTHVLSGSDTGGHVPDVNSSDSEQEEEKCSNDGLESD